jgi:hypothetical protein
MSAGKGDKPRPVDGNKYRDGWEKVFGKKPVKTSKPDKLTRPAK